MGPVSCLRMDIPRSPSQPLPPTNLYAVMIVDGWFPIVKGKPGVWGGRQVHVRELRRKFMDDYQAKVELFYPKNPHPLFKFFWFFYVIVDIFLFARYKKVQVIHAHGETAALAAKIVGSIRKIPVVLTVHSSIHLDAGKKNLSYWWQKWSYTRLKYDAVISVSSHFLRYPNVNQNLTVIPNGVNLKSFTAVKATKSPHPSLIWVGRDDRSKGVDILKKAIVKVRRIYPQLKAELVTNGRLSGKNLIKAYKQAHLFVLPSLTESQPISLLEAWAAKLPVVVTEVGENPLMIKDGENGLLVEPGNVRQLSQAIIRIIRSRTLAPRLGESGYLTVKRRYTWDQVAQQTLRVYRHVINQVDAPITTVMSLENA